MIRKLSPAQERYFGKHRKAKKRVARRTRSLGGHAGIKAKKGVMAEKNGENGEA